MLLTKHSHVWHWYIHCSPLLNLTCFSSWCWHDSRASHCGQHKSRPLPRFHFEQSHFVSSHVITPLLQVHVLHGWLRGDTLLPSATSASSNIQLSLQSTFSSSASSSSSSTVHWHAKWPSVLTHLELGWQLWGKNNELPCVQFIHFFFLFCLPGYIQFTFVYIYAVVSFGFKSRLTLTVIPIRMHQWK